VVTEALATPTKLVNPVAVKPEATGQPDFGREAYVDNDVVDDDDDDDDNGGSDDGPCQPAQQQTMPAHLIGKTIVASDNDVTNGFVKDGKMLPYVFEATESGQTVSDFQSAWPIKVNVGITI
jgi:hypothetical protein